MGLRESYMGLFIRFVQLNSNGQKEPGRPRGATSLWGIHHLPGFNDTVYVMQLTTSQKRVTRAGRPWQYITGTERSCL